MCEKVTALSIVIMGIQIMTIGMLIDHKWPSTLGVMIAIIGFTHWTFS